MADLSSKEWEKISALYEQLQDLPSKDQDDCIDKAQLSAESQLLLSKMLRAASKPDILDRSLDALANDLLALPEAKIHEVPADLVGRDFGPWHALEELDRGGMGAVLLAERSDGRFEKTVALKVVKPGQYSEHTRQRFLDEMRTLARLEHPNIARLIDGGISDDSNPYFAMEYIDGEPITEHADSQQLTIAHRVDLLIQVCQAVEHAHQNLVIHGDIKPANILIDQYGQVKLVDFGIARSLLTGKESEPVLPRFTPGYASPEQAAGEAMTTASDVFGLSAVLYELCCGTAPRNAQATTTISALKSLVNTPSPAPIEQLEQSEDVDHVANRRQLSIRRLRQSIDGDLKWILRRGLQTSPQERYSSAAELREDLKRLLRGSAVNAHPDNRSYQLKRFLSRHKLPVAAASIALAAIVFGSGTAAYQGLQAREATLRATQEARKANETKDFIAGLFEYASPDKNLGERLTVRQLLDLGAIRIKQGLQNAPEAQQELLQLLGDTYLQLGLYDQALPMLEQAAAMNISGSNQASQVNATLSLARLQRLRSNYELALSYLTEAERLVSEQAHNALRSQLLIEQGELAREQARYVVAEEYFIKALALDRSNDAAPSDIARDLHQLAILKVSTEDNEQAQALMTEALSQLADDVGVRSTQYATIQNDLGVLLVQTGDLDAAATTITGALELREALLGNRHPDFAASLKELAGITRLQGDSEKAKEMYLTSLSINQETLGPDHPETSNNLNSLAVLHQGLGNNTLALEFSQRALPGAVQAYGEKHPRVATMMMNIGNIQALLGDHAQAEANIGKGLEIIRSSVGEEHQLAGVARSSLANIQRVLGDSEAAEENYRKSLAIFVATVGEQHPSLLAVHNGLALLLTDQPDRLDESIGHYEQAIAIGEAALPPGHPNVSIVQMGLAHALTRADKCTQAIAIADQHMPILRAANVAERADVVATLDAIKLCRG